MRLSRRANTALLEGFDWPDAVVTASERFTDPFLIRSS